MIQVKRVYEKPSRKDGGSSRRRPKRFAAATGASCREKLRTEHPLWGTLVGVKRGGSHLFLRYTFRAVA